MPKIRPKKDWTLYLLRCRDGTLYTGIAKDVKTRLARHQEGKGAAYTRAHPPTAVVFTKKKLTRSAALRLEAAVKKLNKADKEKMVSRKRLPLRMPQYCGNGFR